MSYNAYVEKYGAKAASLQWLDQSVGHHVGVLEKYQVPPYKVYAVTPSSHSGAIKLKGRYAKKWASSMGGKFAVRSGAPISLPGLMETRLNVDASEVDKAVEEVYKSFDNPSVKKILNKMPEKDRPEGTGVIIQRMAAQNPLMWGRPQNIKYGVVFTVTANGFPDPVFRYSDKPNDIVGSGNEIGISPVHYGIMLLARRWYQEFGTPPEFEIAIKGDSANPETVWLLQVRNQRLTVIEEAVLEGYKLVPPEDAVPTMTIKGGGLAQIGDMSEIEILDESDPSKALDAARTGKKLVMWRRGSPFSHAAVLCRSEGVAYGNISMDNFVDLPALPFTFCDGSIYSPPVELEKKKFADAQDAVKDTNWSILDFLTSNRYRSPVPMKSIGHIFTHALFRYKGYLAGEYYDSALLEFAQVLALTSFMTCLGEMRHDRSEVGLGGYYNRGDARSEVWKSGLDGVFQPPVEWLERLHDKFIDLHFGSGYGGPKWAGIAMNARELIGLLESYRKSPTGPLLAAIDKTVSIMELQEHNAAVYWTKFCRFSAKHVLNQFKISEYWEEFTAKMEKYLTTSGHASLIPAVWGAPISVPPPEESGRDWYVNSECTKIYYNEKLETQPSQMVEMATDLGVGIATFKTSPPETGADFGTKEHPAVKESPPSDIIPPSKNPTVPLPECQEVIDSIDPGEPRAEGPMELVESLGVDSVEWHGKAEFMEPKER